MITACVEKNHYVSISIIMFFLMFIAVGGLRSITIAALKYIDQISKQTRRQALSVSTTHVAVSAPNLTLKAQNSPLTVGYALH